MKKQYFLLLFFLLLDVSYANVESDMARAIKSEISLDEARSQKYLCEGKDGFLSLNPAKPAGDKTASIQALMNKANSTRKKLYQKYVEKCPKPCTQALAVSHFKEKAGIKYNCQ